MILPLNQNVLIERDQDTSGIVVRKSGIVSPTGQVENEGLITGKVLYAPKDQNLLIDKDRPVNDELVKVGDTAWYSKYSTALVLDDREGHEGDYLDLVPLEDIRAIISK